MSVTDPVLAARDVMPRLTGDEMLDAEIVGFARGLFYRFAEQAAEIAREAFAAVPRVPWDLPEARAAIERALRRE